MTRKDKIMVGAMCTFILVLAILRYGGVPDQYAIFYAFSKNPEHFINDLYLNNTFYFDSSYFFAVNNFLGLNNNEAVTFTWYLAVTVMSFYFTYQIISQHFGIKKPLEIFLILLFVSIVDRGFPNGGWGGVIPTAAGIPAMYAKLFGLMAVYYMLEKKIWLSAAIITITISIHISGDFILFPILFFFVIFNKEIPNRNLAALILPVAFLIYRSSTTNLEIPSGSGQEIEQAYNLVMRWVGKDSDFLDHPKMVVFLFAASFVAFIAFWRRLVNIDFVNPNLMPFLTALCVASLLLVCFYTFYVYYGYQLFFYSPLIPLAPVRAMNYYSLFFYLSAFVLILQSARLTSTDKIALLLALVMVHGQSIGGILYPAVILTGGFVFSRVSGDKLSWLKGEKALVPLSLALLIALTGARVTTGTVYKTSFNLPGWQYMKRWTKTIDADETVFSAYEKIRDVKSDFNMLPFYRDRNGDLVSLNEYTYILAEKSHFISYDHYFFFNLKFLAEHKIRKKAYHEIASSIENNKPLSKWVRNVLQNRNVVIVAPQQDSTNLEGWAEKTVIGNFNMLRYSN
jgi:hypothetical protein